ncbi:acyl carrier protein [Butyrivibrio sp. XPD2006]|uniref:acyl carrier protein n=1 Tax=Butyrivibrio sp. XPD2006 TaxID=1280668 RepID=UPI0003B6F73A|nr:acyl carrier protein [Butyrivibrio sp. XPD2006]
MSESEKLKLLEEAMEMDEGSLKPELVLDEIEEYDSLTKLAIIVLIEDEFGKKLSASDFKGFTTVADILSVMEA